MAHFSYEGQRLAYTSYGEGSRTTVLLPGLLLSQKMQMPLARRLAGLGNRVITLDLLGHGASDRPRDMWRYSMATYGRQVVALLDHLGIERADEPLDGRSVVAQRVIKSGGVVRSE